MNTKTQNNATTQNIDPHNSATRPDLKDPELYLNRELTWLSFNERVLHEAQDERNPLLERLKFLAITGSNLDEFFMKRIGGLKQQVGAGMGKLTVDGRTARQQISECYEQVRKQERQQRATLHTLLDELREQDVKIFLITPMAQPCSTTAEALEVYVVQHKQA
ncbi:MAG: RNA degradosome polyphosphate kinase, partial [gamma proteobacterium symbiont of Bathyaustriella thionipta]|nr:RNA degradosome polyphosphate kinase [gamma proteobacterium symbiont of Bathyaustriella thionipta]